MKTDRQQKWLGIDKFGLDYYLGSDLYVYQFSGNICYGWYCSLGSWERTMHKCLIK
jgi:hypothetical protein